MTRALATDLMGYGAAVCTTASFLPQLLRVIRTRSARDISLGMFIIYCVGIGMWLCFGILVNSMPMMVANAITLILALCILVAKIRFDAEHAAAARRHCP
jgi:MtN3 and saliva related transmembrane protein